MFHRSPYHLTRRRAILAESIFQSVKSTQSMGSAFGGALISVAISTHNGVAPQLFLQPTRGGWMGILAHRSSSVAVRAGRPVRRGISAVMVAPQGWRDK